MFRHRTSVLPGGMFWVCFGAVCNGNSRYDNLSLLGLHATLTLAANPSACLFKDSVDHSMGSRPPHFTPALL